MTQDLRALFGLDGLENNHDLITRTVLAQSIHDAALDAANLGLTMISLSMSPQMALEMARDLRFAACAHPTGVPDEMLPSSINLPPSRFQRPNKNPPSSPPSTDLDHV